MSKKVLFILGTAHCGSTLLTLMLNSHPQCFAVGEISNLPHFYKKKGKICSVCQGTCNFWDQQFSSEELQQLTLGLSNSRINPKIPLSLEKIFRGILGKDEVFKPYSLIASKLKEEILVDSTKTIDWISQELTLKEFKTNLTPYLLHLVRDGRAVMNSYLRARSTLTVDEFSHLWQERVKANEKFFTQFSPDRKIKIAYEELAINPSETLSKICHFLGINFRPDMLEFWKNEHHIISGNKTTRSLIGKYQEYQEKQPAEEQSLQIKLDLRWKKTLSSEQIAKFYQIVGDTNRPYEWGE